jgi:hypothetical protein
MGMYMIDLGPGLNDVCRSISLKQSRLLLRKEENEAHAVGRRGLVRSTDHEP